MVDSEKQEFTQVMVGCAVIFDKSLTKEQIQIYWHLLAEYSLEQVKSAISVICRKSKFFPKPAEIIEILNLGNKHIGADEAWVIAKKSFDEAETVVLTDEIFKARNVASELWNDGDQIGARMAFRSAYERFIENANAPVWRVVAGWDKTRVLPAVEQAKALGRLGHDYHVNQNLLPVGEAQTTVVALLENMQAKASPEDLEGIKHNIARMRAVIEGGVEAVIDREKSRQQFEQHREAELSRLNQKMQHG